MTVLSFPYTVFKTKNRMNDYGAPDMRYGDLTESQLTSKFALRHFSFKADPFKLIELTEYDNRTRPILPRKFYMPTIQAAKR